MAFGKSGMLGMQVISFGDMTSDVLIPPEPPHPPTRRTESWYSAK